jgi:flotillin
MQMPIDSRMPDLARPREDGGWRQGRPVEDPSKTKRWGFITAKPSEFLVHCRRGRVLPTSGQGATCFKWPWDSISVVPTSLQRLHFCADQITRERVGVSITALAVYRVAEPLLAYRVLNFSYPERAQEKLERTLTEMLIGATRRLVANLSVDECLQKRKAALADELLRELAPVIGGEGRLDDRSDRGWGIVLDTVEIQEVRVLSDSVFAAMQAPYRAALHRRAREAQLETDAAIAEREEAIERQELERRSQQQLRQLELALQEEQAEIAAHELRARALDLRAELERREWRPKIERRVAEAQAQSAIDQRAAEVSLAAAAAELRRAEAQARVSTAQNLPALASAVGARFGEVKVTQFGGEQNPFGSIAQAVAAVIELAREA